MAAAINFDHLLDDQNCNLFSLLGEITSEESARAFFEFVGVIPTTPPPACPACNANDMRRNNSRAHKLGFRWRCHACGHRINPASGSFFEHTHLSFLFIFRLFIAWFFRLPVSTATQNVVYPEGHPLHGCHITYITAIDYFFFFREICEVIVANDFTQIGGPGMFVEVDESHLCKRKYHRGRLLA